MNSLGNATTQLDNRDRNPPDLDQPDPVACNPSPSRSRIPTAISVAALAVAAAAVNIWWLGRYRAGLPFNIDEAGYLQRALLSGKDMSLHGFVGLVTYLRRPDTVAPLLPIVSGSLHDLFGLGVFNMLRTQEISYALAIVAAYALSRSFAGRAWSLFVAFLAASLPGLIDAGRLYLLAEPAAACYTLAIVALLRAGSFDSLWRSSLWGLIVGLTSLTRTMMIALLMGVAIAALFKLIRSGITKRRLANFAAGGVVAFGIAWSWYADSWRTVLAYLSTYGYGSEASKYGSVSTPVALNWWTVRLRDLVNQDIYLPIAISLILSGYVLGYRVARRVVPRLRRSQFSLRSSWSSGLVLDALASDAGIVLLILFLGWLALSSTVNGGSYFELPLAVPLVCVVVAPVGKKFGIGTVGILTAGLLAAGLTVVDQAAEVPQLARYSTVELGRTGISAFNATEVDYAGSAQEYAQLGGTYWAGCSGATYTCWYGRTTGISVRYLQRWESLNNQVTDLVQSIAAQHHRTPVIFVAYQGPLLNTNTIALAGEEKGKTLIEGALRPKSRAHAGLQTQLMSPDFGQPNIVLAGVPPAPGRRAVGLGSPVAKLRTVVRLLRVDGFRRVKTVDLPGQEPMAVWWLNR